MHLDGAHDPAVDASLFDCVLRDSAEEVSSSDDDGYLAAEGVNGCEFFGYFVDENGVDSEASASSQSFA
jgi:hypothetical protein